MAKENQIIQECKNLVEQNEPFQKKMRAKHSRLKKRVIGHGGQSNTPPFTQKPSMKRSKSAPPIGENVYYIDEGLFDFFKKKDKPEQKETEKYTDYNKMHDRIYIGSAPINKGKVMANVLDNPEFDKIYIMSNQVADVIKNYYDRTNESIPNKLVLSYSINDTENPTDEEKTKLLSSGNDAVKFLQKNPNSSVLFTCSHGFNRSATGACLTAMSLFGMSADEAINKAVQARGDKALTYPGKKPQQHPFTNVLRGVK